MPYVNSRLYALLALGLSLLAVPGLHAQNASGGIRGDVDGDGRVTRADANAVRAYLVRGTVPAGSDIMVAGDANADGRVTAADAALISRFAAGVDVSRFPVGRPLSEGGGRVASSENALMFTEYECRADSRAGTLVCGVVASGNNAGVRQDVLLYTGGAQVVVFGGPTFTSLTDGVTPDTMKVTLGVKNLLQQSIGTIDGETADTVRLVFTQYVQANANANVLTADGTMTFVDSVNGGTPVVHPNKQYMDYVERIAPNDTSGPREVRIAYNQALAQLNFRYRIWSRLQYKRGNVVIAGADSIVGAGQTLALSGTSYSNIGTSLGNEGYNWISSNNSVASVNPSTGLVTGVSGGTVTITATSNAESQRGGTRVIRVIQANPETVNVTGNVRLSSTGSVLENDTIHPSAQIAFVGWNGTPDVTQQGGSISMTTTGGPPNRGKFVYNPPAGFDDVDSLMYVIQAGSAVDTGKVALDIDGMIWFVDATPDSACISRTTGCGRLTSPYSTLAAFNSQNNGAGNNPAAGDAVFLEEGTHAGSVTLLAQQRLIGQNATGDLATLAGISLAAGSDALPPLTPGGATARINGTVTLGADNHLRGVNIFAGSGAALVGTSFGTPVIAEVDSLSATGGPVLDLNTGTVSSTFVSVTSTGSSNFGLRLRSINGSLTVNAGSVTDADSATFQVSGGNVGVTWPGTLDQPNNAALVDVASHTGTLVFSGALSANNGSGLQFNAAQGTYTFSGTAALSGTNAGIDITNGSAGTFNFNAGTQITNTAGTGLYVYGSAPALVSYAGGITKGGTSTGRLVELGELTGGTVTFTPASTLTANSTNAGSTGISLSNVAAAVNFDGTANLTGGDAGIDILSASSGTFVFSANTLVQNPSGTAFNVNGSSPNITYNGSLIRTANNALLVDITSMAAGKTITFNPAAGTDSLYATIGDGILLSNVDGAVDFNARVRLAGGNAGVDIVNGSTGNIDFDAAIIVNPTGEALRIFNGSGGDQAADVSFAGAISTNAGRPVLVEDVSGGTVAVSASINTTAGLGLLVQNNSGGTFTFSNATQALNTAGNAAVTLLNNTGATVNFTGGNLDVDVTSGAGFSATGGGTVTIEGANNTVNATGGGTAVNIQNTTIGGNGVRFVRVDATGSGTNGIVLSNTGAGGFEVSGDGASDPNNTTRGRTTAKAGGGTVALGSGGSISGRSGHGVSLSSTGPVVLRNMAITGSGSSGDGINASTVARLTVDNTRITGHASDHGILGNSVGGLALHHSEVDNNGTTVGVVEGSDIWNVRLLGLTGIDTVRNSNIHHSQENVFGVINTSGTLNLTVMNTNITDTGTGAGGSIAMFLAANGSSSITANFQNDSINRGRARGLQASTETGASATLNLTVNGSQFLNNDIGIENAHGSSGTNTFSITNNNLQTNVSGSGQAINMNRLGSASFNGFGLFTGTISGNTIGTAGIANSGSDTGSGIEVESNGSGGITRVAIVNNTIREVGLHGIYVAAVDANIGGTAQPTLEARVASNSVSNMEAALALDGIHVLPGALNTDDLVMCVDIANNTATGIRNGLRVRPSGLPAAPSTVQLEGWDGATAVATYFTNRPNTLAGGVAAISVTAPPSPGGFVAVANCNTP